MKVEPFEAVFLPSPDFGETAEEVKNDLLSPKSKIKYEFTYNNFLEWRQNRDTKSTSETILTAYFEELSEKYKPSTLWLTYNILKNTIKLKENIDISKYGDLTSMIKQKSEGFESKKSNILTSANIKKFLIKAPDYHFLATKVILIVGICGACRKTELVNIKVKDITKQGDLYVVKIPTTKTKKQRFFTIIKEFGHFIKEYQNLRPVNTPTDKFFVNYKNGDCTVRSMGVNNIAKIPRQIASYLKLPNPMSYTGHSFRRSGATLAADSGTNTITLKRLGDWKCNTIAEGYIQESVGSKAKISKAVESAVALSSTSDKAVISFGDRKFKREKLKTIINVGTASTSTAVKASNAPLFKFENCSVTIINNYTNGR